MYNDLYFIPLIATALNEPDPREALKAAMATIREMGQQPAYARGYQQFLAFLGRVLKHGEASEEPFAEHRFTDERALGELEFLLRQDVCTQFPLLLVVSRNGEPFGAPIDPHVSRETVLECVHPGTYAVRTDTGCVLWQGSIAEEHVYWEKAYPGQSLLLAADSFGVEMQPTIEVRLPQEGLCIRTYPGLESGRMLITFSTEDGPR